MVERVSVDQLIDDLTTVIRDAVILLRATAALTGDRVEEIRPKAEESVRQAKARLDGIEEEALKHARVLAGEADEFVRGNPWQAIGIAAGVGLVLGLLMTRR